MDPAAISSTWHAAGVRLESRSPNCQKKRLQPSYYLKRHEARWLGSKPYDLGTTTSFTMPRFAIRCVFGVLLLVCILFLLLHLLSYAGSTMSLPAAGWASFLDAPRTALECH